MEEYDKKQNTATTSRQKRGKVTQAINTENSFKRIYIIESIFFLSSIIWRQESLFLSFQFNLWKKNPNAVDSLSGYCFGDQSYCAERHEIEDQKLIQRLRYPIRIDYYLLWLLAATITVGLLLSMQSTLRIRFA